VGEEPFRLGGRFGFLTTLFLIFILIIILPTYTKLESSFPKGGCFFFVPYPTFFIEINVYVVSELMVLTPIIKKVPFVLSEWGFFI
jgi:hypothetical protein